MNQLLYPPDTGGKIRSSQLFEQLKKDHHITVVCFKRPRETKEQVELMSRACHRLELVEKPETPKFSPAFYAELAGNFLSGQPYIVQKYRDQRASRLLADLWREGDYDLLLCDFLQPSCNVLPLDITPKVLFQHNVESIIRKRQYQNEGNPVKRAVLRWQWQKLFAYEKRAAAAFDHCIMVSREDCQLMAELYGAANTSSIPTGVDVDFFRPGGPEAEEPGLVFTGSMDWLPNQDAMSWFCDEILPLVREKVPARLWIVGRNPSPAMERLGGRPEVTVTGWVEDVRPFVHRAQVFVVPLRIGGGTRIKIFEAFAMQKAVVSTRVGAEGLPVENGRDIRLADEAADLAASIVGLLQNERERIRLGLAARKLVTENHTWEKVARVFAESCRKACA